MKLVGQITALCVCAGLGFLSATATPAWAGNVHRSCKAWYKIHMNSVMDSTHKQHLLNLAQDWSIVGPRGESYTFSARGGCGASLPNRCRRRASEAALTCMQAQFQNPASTPPACRTNNIRNYPVTNLPKLVRQAVCDWMHKRSGVNPTILPKPYAVDTNIFAVVIGDKGCGGGNRDRMEKNLGTMVVSCPVE